MINGCKTSKKTYKPKQMERKVVGVERNKVIIESYKKYGRKKMREFGIKYKTICFCVDINHATRMSKLFNKSGIKSEVLIADVKKQKSSERHEIYQRFKTTHEIEVLCAVNILNEGKDIPDVGCLLFARRTRSPIIYWQQMGRGCRVIEEAKREFVVLDYVDSTESIKHSRFTWHSAQNQGVKNEDFILDWFKGKDKIAIDNMITNIKSSLNSVLEEHEIWTKAKVEKAMRVFYKKHKKITHRDLIKHDELPSRQSIARF